MDMADEDEVLEETLAALGERETTWGVILRESSKAIALQIASPLATLVEVAVLGSRSFSELSVYTLVCAVCNLASVVFNFLSDGVAARHGGGSDVFSFKSRALAVRISIQFDI